MASPRTLVALAALHALALLPAAGQGQLWIQQMGSPDEDYVTASAPKADLGFYTAGWTDGDLGGPAAGGGDAWLALHDEDGVQRWVRQMGTSSVDAAWAAAEDGANGAYVAGHTQGALGGPLTGPADAWLARYDPDGDQLWIRQFGAPLRWWHARAAAPDGSGGVFVSGTAWNGQHDDVWIARYDADGAQLWLVELGSNVDDVPLAAAADGAGGVFVGGYTRGALGGPWSGNDDSWVARYDGAGTQLWIRQLGVGAHDRATAVASDGAGGVFVGGYLGQDNRVLRYDGAGALLWERGFGTSSFDLLQGAAPDGAGGVHLTGYTLGNYAAPAAGFADVWIARFDAAGAQQCAAQLGTAAEDRGLTAARDGAGNLYVAGTSLGALGGPHQGERDVWLARYDAQCQPCGAVATYCTAKLNSDGCAPSISGSGVPSVQGSGAFTILTSDVLAGQVGIYFYGKSGASNAPFLGGTLCVQPPTLRAPPMSSGGGGPCGGSFLLDFNAFLAGGGDPALHIGQQLWLQAWSRDPGDPFASSLSDALTFSMCP